MPCRDPREDDEPERVAKELNERTDMLCRVMRLFDTLPHRNNILPKDVRDWYDKHEAFDKKQGR